MIKDGWKLLHLQVNNPKKEKYELYNLATDPGEIADVVKQYPQKVQELKGIMQKARTTNDNWKFAFEQ